jgi:hypothetical protein
VRASRASAALCGLFAPLELALQEFARQPRIGLVARIDAVQAQEVFRARDRLAQRPIRFVHARRRLQRDALVGVRAVRETVGMHLGLQAPVGVVERLRVEVKALGQSEQLEVVAGEVDHRK